MLLQGNRYASDVNSLKKSNNLYVGTKQNLIFHNTYEVDRIMKDKEQLKSNILRAFIGKRKLSKINEAIIVSVVENEKNYSFECSCRNVKPLYILVQERSVKSARDNSMKKQMKTSLSVENKQNHLQDHAFVDPADFIKKRKTSLRVGSKQKLMYKNTYEVDAILKDKNQLKNNILEEYSAINNIPATHEISFFAQENSSKDSYYFECSCPTFEPFFILVQNRSVETDFHHISSCSDHMAT